MENIGITLFQAILKNRCVIEHDQIQNQVFISANGKTQATDMLSAETEIQGMKNWPWNFIASNNTK